MPAARAAWEERAQSLTSEAERRTVQLLLWPHAEDAVSDIPGIVTFFRSGPGSKPRSGAGTASAEPGTQPARTWGLLLDPAAMLTPAMLANAEDHIWRMGAVLRELDVLRGRVAGVVLRDRRQDGSLGPLAGVSGLVPPLARALRTGLFDVSAHLVVTGGDPDGQLHSMAAVVDQATG
jgi:hypothetical protein